MLLVALTFALVLLADAPATISTLATPLPRCEAVEEAAFRAASPDGSLTLVVDGRVEHEVGEACRFRVESGDKPLRGSAVPWNSPELLWAPDSAAFAITSTDGGLVGSWRAQVFVLRGDRLREIDATRFAREDILRRFPPCDFTGIPGGCTASERRRRFADPDWVNLFALQWINGSLQLLVAAGTPPSSSYGRNAGQTRGYIIDIATGVIVSQFDECELRRRWGNVTGLNLCLDAKDETGR